MELKKLKGIKTAYLVIIMVVGVLIVFLSNSLTSAPKREDPPDIAEDTVPTDDAEDKLREIIESIDGVSDVKVYITYENRGVKSIAAFGEESVATDGAKKTVSSKSEPVTVKSGSGESPFVDEEILPEVRGVIIAARGIKSPQLEARITDAVSSALGVPVNRVRILPVSHN